MKCPQCKAENPTDARFCNKCGNKMEMTCPVCSKINPPESSFCNDCGYNLLKAPSETLQTPSKPSITDHERKQVTVLFSDLSGYTAMTEKLDPEEVKEIMDRIFGKISQVVVKYEGFIEKYIGDAVMAIFGIPRTHEDDPVRAIRTALEIHHLVSEISPALKQKIGRPLAMHTGINTGLVVAQEINLEKGTHGVLGDTINVASRISGLAKADEIIVGVETYYQAEGYFNFETLKPATVKGKEEPVHIYKVLSSKETISKTHRLSGLRAELIGRRVEMDQLKEAVKNLKQGKASIFSIVGDAGTGKSRLVEEFRKLLDPAAIQWREAHCYGYSQNIPYFPLMDLLSRAWQIREGDSQDQIRQKLERGAKATLEERTDLIPIIGSLYSLSYPEIGQVIPEQWKARLHEAVKLVLANLCSHAPTVICIEDLHWADPSSVELLQNILADIKYPVIMLCLYRPSFSLFTSHQSGIIKSYQEIRLQHLSPSDAQSMVESLLKTSDIPRQLQLFVRDKAEGNPFYLEEVINSLIETDTLVQKESAWKLARDLTDKDIPSTVQGVISARLDRLERGAKRVLQEASVIGRTFLYEILKRISDLKEYIDTNLINLERLDLIKTVSLQPEMEYIFKHALTQEVVYNGLLIKERRTLHEKIALVMEELFHDRLSEFYETLAYHYMQSDDVQKAFAFLVLSGDKAVKSYANAEAIRFFREALRELDALPDNLRNQKDTLAVSLKIAAPWICLAFPEGCLEIIQNAEIIAEELGDKESLSQFYNSLSAYYSFSGNPSMGMEYAEKNLHLEENIEEESKDHVLVVQNASQLCFAYWFKGDVLKTMDIGGKAIRILEEQHLEKAAHLGTGFNAYATICCYYGSALGWIGRLKEGIAVLEKGFRIACEVNDKMIMGLSQVFHSATIYLAGYGDDTIAHAQKAIKIFEEAEIPLTLDLAWFLVGAGYYLRGEDEKAIDATERGSKLAKESGLPFGVSIGNLTLAMAFLDISNLKLAKERAEEALKIAQECNAENLQGVARIVLACAVEKCTPAIIEEAQRQIQHDISILEKLNQKLLITFGYFFLGMFLSRAGRNDEGLQSLRKAETLYQEMEVTSESYWLTRTKNAIKKLECLVPQ